MNLLRNELKSKFSQIPNEIITDLTISSGALRVLLYLFTKPDEWNVYNDNICNQLQISEKTLTKYWKELLSSKWLRREKRHSEDGKFNGGYIYHIGTFTISEHFTDMEKVTTINNTIPINNNKNTFVLSQAQELVNQWNSFAQDNSLQRVMKLTEKRIKKIQARFKDTETFDKVFIAMLQKIKQSSFLLGINSTWKVDFDFLIDSEQNYVKVIEGKYDDKDIK